MNARGAFLRPSEGGATSERGARVRGQPEWSGGNDTNFGCLRLTCLVPTSKFELEAGGSEDDALRHVRGRPYTRSPKKERRSPASHPWPPIRTRSVWFRNAPDVLQLRARLSLAQTFSVIPDCKIAKRRRRSESEYRAQRNSGGAARRSRTIYFCQNVGLHLERDASHHRHRSLVVLRGFDLRQLDTRVSYLWGDLAVVAGITIAVILAWLFCYSKGP